MAARARGHARERVPLLVDVPADAGEVLVAHRVGERRLAAEVGPQRAHVVLAQILRLVVHRSLAPTALEVGQLLGDVLRVLAGQARKDRARALAFEAMAKGAARGDDLLGALEIGCTLRIHGDRRGDRRSDLSFRIGPESLERGEHQHRGDRGQESVHRWSPHGRCKPMPATTTRRASHASTAIDRRPIAAPPRSPQSHCRSGSIVTLSAAVPR